MLQAMLLTVIGKLKVNSSNLRSNKVACDLNLFSVWIWRRSL